jgi:hypothetical protein
MEGGKPETIAQLDELFVIWTLAWDIHEVIDLAVGLLGHSLRQP